ncbi:hypothetical protein [Kribbella sp. NPDC006257]|uniref:hypothetical protein n=1 Tax=Kribbella sp. NPDC006257 TaxID=3156738 RepID=UPI0033A894D2
MTTSVSSTIIDSMISQPKNAAPYLNPRYAGRSSPLSVVSVGNGLSGTSVTLVIARWAAARASS